jgi:hypothetical protein
VVGVFGARDAEVGTRLGDWLSLEAVLRPSDTLRTEQDQAFAVQVEVDQREVGAEPVMVLFDAPVFHLVEAEDAFQYAESMFYFRSDPRLGRVLPFSDLSTHLRRPRTRAANATRRCIRPARADSGTSA